MRINLFRQFILTCCVLFFSGLLFVACGTSPNLEKTSTAPAFVEEFLSTQVDGEEFTVPSGQAIVIFSDHLPQAGGSGDETVSKEVLNYQLKSLAFSPAFKEIPAVWGLINHCRYTIYVDAYYVGTLHIRVVDSKMALQIVAKWRTDNHVATHYTSENEIPCLAA